MSFLRSNHTRNESYLFKIRLEYHCTRLSFAGNGDLGLALFTGLTHQRYIKTRFGFVHVVQQEFDRLMLPPPRHGAEKGFTLLGAPQPKSSLGVLLTSPGATTYCRTRATLGFGSRGGGPSHCPVPGRTTQFGHDPTLVDTLYFHH